MLSSVAALAALLAPAPTFYRDVLPILQDHCHGCHRPSEIGRMSLLTYRETRPWAKAIRQQVLTRKMPPWFADRTVGHFANDPSLSEQQIATIAAWAEAGAPAGPESEAPPRRTWTRGWNIATPDLVTGMGKPYALPASGAVDYVFEILPLNVERDQWVSDVEVRPSDRAAVHHAVLYVRERESPWLRDRRPGTAFVPREGRVTTSDILAIYTPGHGPFRAAPGRAKKLPAGCDLVLQLHYTPTGRATQDQTRVGIVFAKSEPTERVLTLQLNATDFLIPAGAPHHRVSASGTMPNDALLLGFFPHLHLRGAEFEYELIPPSGGLETLLRVKPYNFYWQLYYELREPLPLKKGTRLRATAWYDNSANNPRNPDAAVDVDYGEQSEQEMMVGFFDISVPAAVDKKTFFVR